MKWSKQIRTRGRRHILQFAPRLGRHAMARGELLLRGNHGTQATSKLTGVVDEAYTTDSVSVPGANYGFSSAQRQRFLPGS
jgi:hypothetical protein